MSDCQQSHSYLSSYSLPRVEYTSDSLALPQTIGYQWPYQYSSVPPGSLSSAPSEFLQRCNYSAEPHFFMSPQASFDSSQDAGYIQWIKQIAQAELSQPGMYPLSKTNQLFDQYLTVPQHSDTAHSVQSRTEGSCSIQNTSIPHVDDYPPFNPFTFEISSYAPTLPCQSPSPSLTSLPPSPPTWAKTGDLPTTQFYHLAGDLLNSLPPFATEQPAPADMHHSGSSPSEGQGTSAASGPREYRKKAHEYHCNHPGCSAKYSTPRSLGRHARSHLPPDPEAKCQWCRKQFSRTDALRRHERTGVCKARIWRNLNNKT